MLATAVRGALPAAVQPAFSNTLSTSGDGSAACLADLQLHVEVEFSLPLDGSAVDGRRGSVPSTERLLQVLRRFGYADNALRPDHLRGMLRGTLRGFMDAVFAWQGRYFILDYKSNYLGPTAANYGAADLQEVMRAHRYDLQLLIYAVALRRWLRVRGVPAARPEALYWFIRGIDAPGAGLYHHVPSVEVLDALDAVFNGATP